MSKLDDTLYNYIVDNYNFRQYIATLLNMSSCTINKD